MKILVIIFVLIFCFSCKKEKESIVIDSSLHKTQIDSSSNFNSSQRLEKNKLQKIKDRFYHIKIYDNENIKDTIVRFDFLESDLALDYDFNYEPFIRKVYSDSIILFTKNFEVSIHKKKFDKSNSGIVYDSDSLSIVKIDNHSVIGVEDIPNTYISKINLHLGNRYFEIDKQYFEDLYEPNFNLTEAYYYDKEIIITMSNSDGYLGYNVTFFLDSLLNIKRIVSIP